MATVKLTWTNAADTSDHSKINVYRKESGSLVSEYALKVDGNKIAQPAVGANNSSQEYEDSGAEIGKSYCYGVYSANSGGVSNVGDRVHIDVN